MNSVGVLSDELEDFDFDFFFFLQGASKDSGVVFAKGLVVSEGVFEVFLRNVGYYLLKNF